MAANTKVITVRLAAEERARVQLAAEMDGKSMNLAALLARRCVNGVVGDAIHEVESTAPAIVTGQRPSPNPS